MIIPLFSATCRMRKTIWIDPIVAELHKMRKDRAKRFACDVDAIFANLKRQEQESGQTSHDERGVSVRAAAA